MAATPAPMPYPDEPRREQRPNVASADVRLPAVRSYEQVDREIGGTRVLDVVFGEQLPRIC